MKNIGHFSRIGMHLSLLLSGSIFPGGAALAAPPITELPRIFFPAEGGVAFGEREAVHWARSADGIEIGAYASTAEECRVSPGEVLREISTLLESGGSAGQSLKNLFGENPTLQFARTNSLVLITPANAQMKGHSSFFIHRMPALNRPVVVLDCSPTARSYWTPSLAHEMTHALLHEKSIPSWFEESFAQLTEAAAGGERPEKALRVFQTHLQRRESKIPALWNEARPLFGFEQYALSYLFGKYLIERFGGWPMLRAMLDFSGETDFASLVERGRQHLREKNAADSRIEHFSPKDLLRFFAVAVVLNSPAQKLYSIPGWYGLRADSARTPSPDTQIAPGQFLITPVTAKDPTGQRFHPELEVYRLRYSTAGFEIFPRSANALPKPGAEADEVVLVIHFGPEKIPLYR